MDERGIIQIRFDELDAAFKVIIKLNELEY